MSDLGDLIVHHLGAVLGADIKPEAWAQLRDELIELRRIAKAAEDYYWHDHESVDWHNALHDVIADVHRARGGA